MAWVLPTLIACLLLCITASDASSVFIQPWCDNSLRVRIGPDMVQNVYQGLMDASLNQMECKINPTASSVAVTGSTHITKNGNIESRQDVEGGVIQFIRRSDGVSLLETVSYTLSKRNGGVSLDVNGNNLYRASISFKRRSPNDTISGLGEHKFGQQPGVLNYGNGYSFSFQKSANSDISIPVFQSSDGYMFLWNTPSYGSVNINSTHITFTSNATTAIDFWISVGSATSSAPTAYPSLMKQFVDATGHPSKLPYYATGFIQSKLRYRSQSEVLAVAREYVKRGLPLSMIAIDYFHWEYFGDWSFTANSSLCWPDPTSMTRELESLGVTPFVSVWPNVEPSSINYEEFQRNNYLVKNSTSLKDLVSDAMSRPAYLYDPTNKAAREALFAKLVQGYVSHGIKAFWLDSDEPGGAFPGEMLFKNGHDLNIGMIYPREHQRGVYEGLVNAGIEEPFTLSRSAWIGSAAVAGAVWSGDIQSNFMSLNQQIRVAQNMAMSGIYLWTTDIGGFYVAGEDTRTPEFRELIVRWFQFGAFCPLFRLHGRRLPMDTPTECGSNSGGPNEIWSYGEPAYSIIRDVVLMREQLRGYIANLWKQTMKNGLPLLRPMFFDFVDAECLVTDDQFLFGKHFLVAPVYVYQARSRDVYLPVLPGGEEEWVYYYDVSQRFAGGQWLRDFSAPLSEFPLFVKSSFFREHMNVELV